MGRSRSDRSRKPRGLSATTPEPDVVNGWTILAHPLMLAQLERLVAAAEAETVKVGTPATANRKVLVALQRLMFVEIPADPTRADYRQGNTLGMPRRHWFRAKFAAGRFRLFFRFRKDAKVIVFAWVNDQESMRTYGSATDAYDTNARHHSERLFHQAAFPWLHSRNGSGRSLEVEPAAMNERKRAPSRVSHLLRAVLFVCLVGGPLVAQTRPPVDSAATIRGRLLGVFDEQSGEPIADAVVTDAVTGDHALTTRTGTVSLWFVKAKGSIVQVRKLGYEPWSDVVDPTEPAPITVTLKRVTTLLPIVTTATHDMVKTQGRAPASVCDARIRMSAASARRSSPNFRRECSAISS